MPIERIGRNVRVVPGGAVTGVVRPPGSKSLTNRYLVCTALADGRSFLRGVSVSDDVRAMLDGLMQLGIRSELRAASREILVTGCRGIPPADQADIHVGQAGTAMRFLTALACLGFGSRRLDGSARMRQRPIRALVDALVSLGARISYEVREGYPPLMVLAGGLSGGTVVFDRPVSSQFLSALLMVAPYATQDVLIEVRGRLPSRPYVDLTADVMRRAGVEVVQSDGRFVVPAFQRYQPGSYDVEPDASAAAYLWAAAAATGGCVRVEGLSRASAQGDVRFVDLLARMGCQVRHGQSWVEVQAPAVGRLSGIDADLSDVPDTAQTLAVLALLADGPTRINNVANLRFKETDRIAALATELTRLGATVEVRDDGLTIHPPARVRPAEIETYGDHRMAMSFALLGLVVEGITIRDADCVSKSFPDFFEVLGSLQPLRQERESQGGGSGVSRQSKANG